jgi:hypothetical protein
MSTFYPPPLDRLLRLGAEPARRRSWPNYLALGLEERHVADLARMATDPALHDPAERGAAAYAPVHAWRALGQFGPDASAAAAPLLALLERELESDWVYAELPTVLGMIGPAALPGLTILLFDDTRDEDLRIGAAAAVAEVARQYPERRDEAVALLSTQLQDWANQGRALNAFLIDFLAELDEKPAAPLMEAAFDGGAVELSLAGDWEDVQVRLGLLAERQTPPLHGDGFDDDFRAGSRQPAANAAARSKARRKAEKQARKRNRKKK